MRFWEPIIIIIIIIIIITDMVGLEGILIKWLACSINNKVNALLIEPRRQSYINDQLINL